MVEASHEQMNPMIPVYNQALAGDIDLYKVVDGAGNVVGIMSVEVDNEPTDNGYWEAQFEPGLIDKNDVTVELMSSQEIQLMLAKEIMRNDLSRR